MAVAVKSTMIWGVTSCSLVDVAGMAFKTWEQANQTASSLCVQVDSPLFGLFCEQQVSPSR
jgi:hypothetical protein